MEYLGQELFEQGGDDWQSLVKMGKVHLKLLVLAGIGVGDEGEEVGEGEEGVKWDGEEREGGRDWGGGEEEDGKG